MSKIKIKFLGIPNVKRFYSGDGIECDTHKKDTCVVEVNPGKAAQLMVDHPTEWEYVTRKGSEVIGKEITEYQNKVISEVNSTKGIIVEDKNGSKTNVEPKSKVVKKPTKTIKKPGDKK